MYRQILVTLCLAAVMCGCQTLASDPTSLRKNDPNGEGGGTDSSSRVTGNAMQALGVSKYVRQNGSNRISFQTRSGDEIGSLTSLPARAYEVTWKSEVVVMQPSADRKSVIFTDVQGSQDVYLSNPEAKRWDLKSGSGAVRSGLNDQILVGATAVKEIGEKYLLRISQSDNSLRHATTRKSGVTSLSSNTGCYDNGFCSAQFSSCESCEGGGSGGGGGGGGGGAGGGAGGWVGDPNAPFCTSGSVIKTQSWGLTEQSTTDDAADLASSACSNNFCTGCCAYFQDTGNWNTPHPLASDCLCLIPGVELFCECNVIARACGANP